jgi:hypothetical protein
LRLKEKHNFTSPELVKELAGVKEMSPSHLENLIRAAKNLIPKVQDAWRIGKVPLTILFSWAKLDHDKQGEAWAEYKGTKADGTDNAPEGGSEAGKAEKPTKTRRRASELALMEAARSAKTNEAMDAYAALRFALGYTKTLKIGDTVIYPVPEADDSEE